MKTIKLSFTVSDDFSPGNCGSCPFRYYLEDFECFTCIFHSISCVCPLKERAFNYTQLMGFKGVQCTAQMITDRKAKGVWEYE